LVIFGENIKMKRKIVKHGPSSLTISLPAKWVKKQHITAGDELELEEEGSSLRILSKPKIPKELEINLDLSDSGVMLSRAIVAIYKAGFDKANITYNATKELETIQNTIDRSCHAFEIMNIKKHVVEIKAISQLDHSEFNNILRKSAHAIEIISQEVLDTMKSEDYDSLPELILKDRLVDRHTDFCRRLLNQGYDVRPKKKGPLYTIIEQTEIGSDIFKIISRELIKTKKKPSNQIITLFESINKLIMKMYNTFFDFDIMKMKEIGTIEINIRKQIDLICNSTKKDIKLLAYLINLFETIFELKSAILTYHLSENK